MQKIVFEVDLGENLQKALKSAEKNVSQYVLKWGIPGLDKEQYEAVVANSREQLAAKIKEALFFSDFTSDTKNMLIALQVNDSIEDEVTDILAPYIQVDENGTEFVVAEKMPKTFAKKLFVADKISVNSLVLEQPTDALTLQEYIENLPTQIVKWFNTALFYAVGSYK